MLEAVKLTQYQEDYSYYWIQSAFSRLEPEKEERSWAQIKAMAGVTSRDMPLSISGGFCFGTDPDGKKLLYHRLFEASKTGCSGCPLIGSGGVGCIIYDARAHPEKPSATRDSRIERGLRY